MRDVGATYRVYVDSRPVDVPVSATVLDAVESADPVLAAAVRSGSKAVTDSRGLPIASDAPLHGGAILRVVATRQREA
ncbi:MAG: hypothetical protein M3O61_13510 [Gemmatimonadota bacterium]|nr:hypothetical protein [Gemmatimonadota bacterium]